MSGASLTPFETVEKSLGELGRMRDRLRRARVLLSTDDAAEHHNAISDLSLAITSIDETVARLYSAGEYLDD